MRKITIAGVLAAAALGGACSGTGKEGQVEVNKPVVGVEKDTVSVPTVNVGSKVDTINTPTVGTTKDTLIVDRPTVGTKKTEVRTPTVDVKSANENAKRP